MANALEVFPGTKPNAGRFDNRREIGKYEPEMNYSDLKIKLATIYADHDRDVTLYKAGAICKPGCAFCCHHFGSVDMTTLEGRIIRDWVVQQRGDVRPAIRAKIEKNHRAKAKGTGAPCPFLAPDRTCLIYAIRPFSCRQLYSVRPCEGRGPTVHRQARDAAQKTIQLLKRLDANGYSGHISHILCLLDQRKFRKVYQGGGFDPAAIMAFGKKYGIVINRSSLGAKR